MSEKKQDDIDYKKILEVSEKQTLKYAEELSSLYRAEKSKRKALEIANAQLQDFARNLNATLEKLEKTYMGTLQCLALAAEYKDENTGEHLLRMSRYSALLAKKIGWSGQEAEELLYAAPMHDLGKVGIPDYVLHKPGKLTRAEFELMKQHAVIGARILKNLKAPVINLARKIAISHHEKWNGKGYPAGQAGKNIAQGGRIVALADVFDALTTRRPYKDPYPVDVVCDIIRKEREQSFDPEVVDAFFDCLGDFLKTKNEIDGNAETVPPPFQWSERDLLPGY